MSPNGIEIERKGWEIVPYVLREIVPYVPNLNYLSEHEYQEFHVRLNKLMNEAVKESRDRARIANDTMPPPRSKISQNSPLVTEAIPLSSFVRPYEIVHSSQPTSTVGRLKTTIVVESVDFSVAVPKNFPNVDIDKLRLPKAILSKRNDRIYVPRFTFAERLRGWNFEKRMRLGNNTHLDPYYLHYESKVKLRSFVEIVNFLLYEQHPKMFKRKPKAKVEKSKTLGKRKNSGDKSASGRKPKKSKMKAKNPSVNPSSEVTIQEAEEFLSGFENFGKDIGSSSKGKEVAPKETDMDSEETIPGEVISIRNVDGKGKSVVVEVDDDISSAPKNDTQNPDIAIVQEAAEPSKDVFVIEDYGYAIDDIFGGLDDIFPFNHGFIDDEFPGSLF